MQPENRPAANGSTRERLKAILLEYAAEWNRKVIEDTVADVLDEIAEEGSDG